MRTCLAGVGGAFPPAQRPKGQRGFGESVITSLSHKNPRAIPRQDSPSFASTRPEPPQVPIRHCSTLIQRIS